MKIISIENDVQCWAPRGQILAIHYKHKAISVLPGWLPRFFCNGIKIGIAQPARRFEGGEYQFIGFEWSLLPGLNGAVCRWPRWYRLIHRLFRYRNYDACSVLKRRK